MLYAIVKPIAVVLMRLLFRLEAVGRELVPATGPVLIVSNHVSVLGAWRASRPAKVGPGWGCWRC